MNRKRKHGCFFLENKKKATTTIYGGKMRAISARRRPSWTGKTPGIIWKDPVHDDDETPKV